AMVATDHVVIPLSPDLFSVQGLRNLGPTLRRWRREWQDRLAKNPDPSLRLPAGGMSPAGYVCSALAYGWAGRSRRTSVGWPAYPACTGPPCSEWRARPPDRPGSVLSGPTQALPKPPAAGVRGAQADLPAHARGQGFWRSPCRRRRGQQRLLRPGRPATERGGSRAPRRRAVPLGIPSSSSTPRQTARRRPSSAANAAARWHGRRRGPPWAAGEGSALHDVDRHDRDRQTATGGLLVLVAHVPAGLPHRGDDLVE